MPKKDKAAPKAGMAKSEVAKVAKQQVKSRTDELVDDDEFDTDIDLYDDALEKSASEGKVHPSARRKLEDYLEEKRLRRDIEDDFDF